MANHEVCECGSCKARNALQERVVEALVAGDCPGVEGALQALINVVLTIAVGQSSTIAEAREVVADVKNWLDQGIYPIVQQLRASGKDI